MLGLSPRPPDAQNREIVALSAAGGDDDLVGSRAHTSGDPLASLIERGSRIATPAMDARWIAEPSVPERRHRLEHLAADGGGGGVIEIDGVRHARNISAGCGFWAMGLSRVGLGRHWAKGNRCIG